MTAVIIIVTIVIIAITPVIVSIVTSVVVIGQLRTRVRTGGQSYQEQAH
jgi:uncharacterized membrane protein